MTKFARRLAFATLACLSWASIAGAEEAPRWIVDADAPGPDLPPVGRSLFDFLVAVEDGGETVLRVPYPFEDLIALAARHARETTTRPVQQVLIPLGRSLHRNAAHPDFFKSPRAVAVVEAEPLDPPDRPLILLKDRLYLGYQPVTDSIEVISYNEAAGRFEFQVVADYRAGGAPTVYYTDRAVCIGCHQNHAPIFAGEPWEESNSNPKIGALLELEQPSFYGIPSFTGIDIPGLIGNAIDRANMFAAHQLLWREGCGEGADGITCRANVFLSVLRYRLAGQRRSRRRRRAQAGFPGADQGHVARAVAERAGAANPPYPRPRSPGRRALQRQPGQRGGRVARSPGADVARPGHVRRRF